MSPVIEPPFDADASDDGQSAAMATNVELDPLLRLRWKRLANAAKELSPFLRPVRRELIVAVLCSIGNVLMTIARPWPIKMVFDYAIMPSGRVKWVFPYHLLKGYGAMGVASIACALLIAITMLWGVFIYNQRFLISAAGQRVTYDLRRRLFTHLLRQSLSFHRRQRVGDLLLRATGDTNMLREMLVDAVLIIFTEGFVLIAMLAVMLYMDWQLTMVSLAVLPILSLAVFRFTGKIRARVQAQRKREGRVASVFGEMLQSIAVIQVSGREAHEQERFTGSNRRSLREGMRTVRLEANLERISEIMLALGTGGVLWFGVERVLDGALTPGDLVVFTSYLSGMYRPLRRIARVAMRLSKATVCAERVFSILRIDERVRVRRDATAAPRFRGRLTFKDVTFSYLPGHPVLRDVSFTVVPGQTVALVGPNGSGKSTLCALLPRLFDPTRGSIAIDGHRLSRFTLESIREQIGVVLQQPLLFAGTVRDNILYGKFDATDEEIVAAARAANADEFVLTLCDGYETHVGERGDTLSGGQRQKLALARVVIKNPSILVLDEPTTSLDASSAAQVNAALRELSRNRTTIWVSHRLSDVKHADLILVVEAGQITQRGRHEDLMRQSGWYRDTFGLQGGERHQVEVQPPITALGMRQRG